MMFISMAGLLSASTVVQEGSQPKDKVGRHGGLKACFLNSGEVKTCAVGKTA